MFYVLAVFPAAIDGATGERRNFDERAVFQFYTRADRDAWLAENGTRGDAEISALRSRKVRQHGGVSARMIRAADGSWSRAA
ncbi:MAG: hypothetical protein M0Z28_18240 [Rhodospirillales bacterium]|nr:hypothetical protein [Rhodospirillales bacterium]